jgi:hypothetical protein
MALPPGNIRYMVRISVSRSGRWRQWEAGSGAFERRLAGNPAVIAARVDSQTRRGRDYVRVTVAIAVAAPDVAGALTTAWRAFREAAGEDAAGWDMAAATAEVWPDS